MLGVGVSLPRTSPVELSFRDKREDAEILGSRTANSETLLAGVMVHRAGVGAVPPAPGDVVPGLRGRGAAPRLWDAEAVSAARVCAAHVCEGELTLSAWVRARDGETRRGSRASELSAQGRDVTHYGGGSRG